METTLKVNLDNAKTKVSKKKDAKGKMRTSMSTSVKIAGSAKQEVFGFMRNFFRNGGDPDSVEFEITISGTGKAALKINQK